MEEILLGTWGPYKLILDMENKQVKLVSPTEVFEDQYKNPFFSFGNKFVKARKVSVFQNGMWVYFIRSLAQLEEISRKLSNDGYFFEPNPKFLEFLNYLRKNAKDKNFKDITVASTDIILAISKVLVPLM